ncbi:MAG: Uma2 family endonuclease [Cyanobacteria bacterium J06638_22]
MTSLSGKPARIQDDPPRSPRVSLPTMYDLPSEFPEEPGLPDEFHDLQPQLLSRTLELRQYRREHWFSGTDLNVYYDVHHPIWHKHPDWFLAVGVPRLYDGQDMRCSYVVWQEGRSPEVVVEFLSPGTEAEDMGRFLLEGEPEEDASEDASENGFANRATPPQKLEVYERYLRVPHYLVYSRYTQQLRYFKLMGGSYQEQPIADTNPRVWLSGLEVGLGIWDGSFEGVTSAWLRWCDAEGNWFLTDTEQERDARMQAEQQAEQERLNREQAEQQAERDRLSREQAEAQLLQAAQNLLDTGMAIAQVAQVLGLSEEQVRSLQN